MQYIVSIHVDTHTFSLVWSQKRSQIYQTDRVTGPFEVWLSQSDSDDEKAVVVNGLQKMVEAFGSKDFQLNLIATSLGVQKMTGITVFDTIDKKTHGLLPHMEAVRSITERKMTEECKENVMSMELAIQRELAYRKKVASLQSHSDVNYLEDLLPLQVPSSSQSPSPSPWPVSNSDLSSSLITSSSHHQVPSPSQSLSPSPWPGPNSKSSPCLVSSSSGQQVPSQAPIPRPLPFSSSRPGPDPNTILGPNLNHRSSHPISILGPNPNHQPSHPISIPGPNPNHRPSLSVMKKKAITASLRCLPSQQQRQSHNNYIIVDQMGSFFCKACQVPCSGPLNLRQHLKGHKHKAKLQFLQLKKHNGEERGVQMPRCEVCEIWCMNEDALEMHLKGKKHEAKVQELESGRKFGGERVGERPRCELCEIWCMNEYTFQQHLKGKNHITRLYAAEAKKKGQGGEKDGDHE